MDFDEPERNYWQEAHDILFGRSALLTEVRHLEALVEHYECGQIRTANALEELKQAVLRAGGR